MSRGIALACSLLVTGSLSSAASDLVAEPFADRQAPNPGTTQFVRLNGADTGIDFVSRLIPDHPYAYLYHSGMTCSGLAAGDIDGDGRPDLLLANGPGKNALYLQSDDAFHFSDLTAEVPGLDGGDAWASGVALADLDNDGDLDIYICNYEAPNQLFLNLGPGEGKRVHFRECAAEAGVATLDASHFPSFCDYDGDGDLDLYLLTNRVADPRGGPATLPVEFERPGQPRLLPGEDRYYDIWIVDADHWGTEPTGRTDYLFRNEGVHRDGAPRFTDVTRSAGISGRGDGLSCVWWDADGDGDCDLYVANDFISPDKFYINNGDGTFVNRVGEAMPHTTWFSMGSDFGDIDNDGDFDLMIADMAATSHYKSKVTMGIMGGMSLQRANDSNPPQYMRNALFLNEGGNQFREAAYLAHLASSDWTWSVKLADFDGDGHLDVFLSNGVPREMNHSDVVINKSDLVGRHMWEFFKDGKMRKEQNRAFRNQGGFGFEDVSAEWGLDHLGASYGAVWADFDRDGDLDLVVMNLEENVSVYRNQGPVGNQLTIRLEGVRSNRRGIGAVVELEAAGHRWIRQLMPGTGYHSYNEDIVHFGLGEVETVDQLTVRWPSGTLQTLKDFQVNRHLTIRETEASDPEETVQPEARPLFVESPALEGLWHQENPFDDFSLQPLLPHRLSAEGPAMAWGDVNGDGRDDIFLGGASGTPGELRIATESGAFRPTRQDALVQDLAGEDVAAAFADVDGDDDLDLVVARGSYEFPEGDSRQKNGLYLNDGKGHFTASDQIPNQKTNTGSLAVGDFDRDGDPDLFLGHRVRHAGYPASGLSALWINEGGEFHDRTLDMAPDLLDAGLITAGAWGDIDGDGWLDLVLAREWASLAVYRNHQGDSLVASATTGDLGIQTGWWNSLALGDLDGDGDLDLVAGNHGLNTKYKTSPEAPMTLYYGDFDESGERHIVEVKQEGPVCYPERGRSCSSKAMPFIAKKFKTFHEFGIASLQDIYGEQELASAEKFQVTTFEHGVFVNDGTGRFSYTPLPLISQIAPVHAVALHDLDGDKDLDIVLGQNFHGPQSETGNYDGGLGQVLLNEGALQFHPLAPSRSGIFVREAVNALTVRDVDADGDPDLAFATNNGPVRLFTQRDLP